MSANHNKFSQFWQELKRRNVTRVLAVYIAAAFMVFEMVDIVSEPFGLPEWSLKVAFFVLFAGLFIAIIISWIFDVTPKGVEKTKPSSELTEGEKTVASNSWRIATYVSVVVIIGLILLNIFNLSKVSKSLAQYGKSIAVLPFINDSSDEENTYFINGTMESILNNLCMIKDLSVRDRTSVEQYRDNRKPVPEIAKEMDVSYVLEGSGQKIGNRIVLTLQLIDGNKGHHLWSKQYDREVNQAEDYFDLQSEIAQLVAGEIEGVITPEEKERIEKIPTASLTAYDFYQRGREEQEKYWLDRDNKDALERAEELYNRALEYDSTFAQAYTGLASLYWRKHFIETYYSERFLDSVLILCDIALSHDNQVGKAYTLKGDYYRETGNNKQAIEEYNKALNLNPNNWESYRGLGTVYFNDDLLRTIENLQKAASLNRGIELPYLMRYLSFAYDMAGFKDKGDYYGLEALKLTGDSVSYFGSLVLSECWNRNFDKAIEYGKRAHTIDSTKIGSVYWLGAVHSYSGQYIESLKYFKILIEMLESNPDKSIQPGSEHRIGYAFWKNGYIEEGDYYLNRALNNSIMQVDLGRELSQKLISYYDIAAGYAFKGERAKAYENLMIFNQKQTMPLWATTLIKVDPLFDNLRDEPEFQQIVRDIEAKYQSEHERVRQWLEENDML